MRAITRCFAAAVIGRGWIVKNPAMATRFAIVLAYMVVSGCALTTTDQEDLWTETIRRVSDGVVTLMVDHPRAFDGSTNLSTQATGFVVDAEAGLILTNRHVLGAGPSVIYAVFQNGEEVDLDPVYRDPVHDFAFLRYDHSDLDSVEPYEFPLAAQAAEVGLDVRVIGNDAGEQLSILSSTIARLDRNVPEYGRWRYNDFNTFYIQAASGTSPGSSGSPVIDASGKAVALASGSQMQSMSGYFLPLERVERALQHILRGEPVSRGSLQTSFAHEGFAELERLGLSKATLRRVREHSSEREGLLVVESVIPDSPAHSHLEVGDVLIEISGQLITDFVELARVLDDSVGQKVWVGVERAGSVHEAKIQVSDLHAITPKEYLTLGGAILHELSYQQARHYGRPIGGIYLAENDYLFRAGGVNSFSIIYEIDGKQTRTLDELESAIAAIAQGAAARVRWIDRSDPGRERVSLVRFNRQWAPAKRCAEQKGSDLWTCRALAAPPAAPTSKVRKLTLRDWGAEGRNRIARSLVRIHVDIPFNGIDGVFERRQVGVGLIVDSERGWVVTDRVTLPHTVADVRITFDDSLELPASVRYIHPLHNLAVLSYKPSLIESTNLRSAELSTQALVPGEKAYFAGLRSNGTLRYRPTLVDGVTPAAFGDGNGRGFRDFNLELISLVDAPNSTSGVLLDEAQEKVVALWVRQPGYKNTYRAGISAELVVDMLKRARSGNHIRSLEVRWVTESLSRARLLSLPEEWIEAYEQQDPVRRRVLKASRVLKGAPSEKIIREGDLLLAIDGQLVGNFREMEQLTQSERVRLTLLRDGKIVESETQTRAFDGRGTIQVVRWAGANLIQPYRALGFLQGIEPNGVYSTFFYWGSPTGSKTLANQRIISLNEVSTPDLQSFVEVARSLQGRAPVRIKTLDQGDRPSVYTIRLNPHYWPLESIRRTEDGWVLEEIH